MGEIATFSKGQGYSKSDLISSGFPIILYGQLYTNYQTSISDVTTFVNNDEDAIKSIGNEVIVPASGETAEDIARATAIEKQGIIIGGDLNIVKPNKKVRPFFLALTLSNGNPKNSIAKKAQGKSVVHIRNDDLKEIQIIFPNTEEQTAIGNFFKQLNETIALHQRQTEKYQKLKIGFLESIFCTNLSQNNSKKTNAWEQRKLGEIVEIIGGGTPDTTNENYWNGSIDWYSPTEIGNNVYAIKSEKTITKLGLEKSSAKLLPANKTILFTSRASIGDMAILKNQGSTNQGFQSFVVGENLDIYFLYSMGYKIKEFALKNASGSTFLEISKNQLALCPISLPSKQEQTAIGNFFKQLDETIALHQRQIEKYRLIKKLFLEKMFIK